MAHATADGSAEREAGMYVTIMVSVSTHEGSPDGKYRAHTNQKAIAVKS